MILVDACETINESMIQLIFQSFVILTTLHEEPTSTLQKLTIATSLFMASKGPAEEFLAAKVRRLHEAAEEREAEAKSEETGRLLGAETKITDNVAANKKDRNLEHVISMTEAENACSKSNSVALCFCIETKNLFYHEMDFFTQKLPLIGKTI